MWVILKRLKPRQCDPKGPEVHTDNDVTAIIIIIIIKEQVWMQWGGMGILESPCLIAQRLALAAWACSGPLRKGSGSIRLSTKRTAPKPSAVLQVKWGNQKILCRQMNLEVAYSLFLIYQFLQWLMFAYRIQGGMPHIKVVSCHSPPELLPQLLQRFLKMEPQMVIQTSLHSAFCKGPFTSVQLIKSRRRSSTSNCSHHCSRNNNRGLANKWSPLTQG